MIFSSRRFLQKRTNELYFTTMNRQVDYLSTFFLKNTVGFVRDNGNWIKMCIFFDCGTLVWIPNLKFKSQMDTNTCSKHLNFESDKFGVIIMILARKYKEIVTQKTIILRDNCITLYWAIFLDCASSSTVSMNELLCLKNAGAQISLFFTSYE